MNIVDNYLVEQLLSPTHRDDKRKSQEFEDLKSGRMGLGTISVKIPELYPSLKTNQGKHDDRIVHPDNKRNHSIQVGKGFKRRK